MSKDVGQAVDKTQMVRFICTRCKRPLVWASATVSVKCPSCGRWVQANKFWQSSQKSGKNRKNEPVPQQLELF
jgi:predicted RNA-binding Zn-ribbon protein involved in translation (DUF1610 family)